MFNYIKRIIISRIKLREEEALNKLESERKEAQALLYLWVRNEGLEYEGFKNRLEYWLETRYPSILDARSSISRKLISVVLYHPGFWDTYALATNQIILNSTRKQFYLQTKQRNS